MWSTRHSCQIWKKYEFSQEIFEENPIYKISWKSIHPYGRTDGHDTANSRSSQFCEKRLRSKDKAKRTCKKLFCTPQDSCQRIRSAQPLKRKKFYVSYVRKFSDLKTKMKTANDAVFK
jgi:hypothetical protein